MQSAATSGNGGVAPSLSVAKPALSQAGESSGRIGLPDSDPAPPLPTPVFFGDSCPSTSAATKVPRGRTFHSHSQRRVGSDYGDEETALHTPDSINIVHYRSVLLWRGDLSSHLLCVRKGWGRAAV